MQLMSTGRLRARWTSKNDRQRNQIEILVLSLVVLLLVCVVFRDFIFGDKLFLFKDSEDDTYQSYISTYQMMATRLSIGEFSLYSTVLGIGSNLLTAQMIAYDPFAVPGYLVGAVFGLQHIAPMLVYMQLARILCAALAFRYFLRAFSFSPPVRCIAALAYAFSSFATGIMGQHYMFATAPVFLALLLALVERAVNNRRRLPLLALASAALGLWSTYFFYIIMLGVGAYAVLRFFQSPRKLTARFALSYFLPLLGAVLVGAAISGAVLLPSALVMTTSSDRLEISGSLWAQLKAAVTLLSGPEMKTQVMRLFSNQLQGTPWAWTGSPNHFLSGDFLCNALVPVGMAQYLWALLKRPLSRAKVVTLVFIIIVGFASFTHLAGMVFNFFVGYATRYTLVLVPLLGYLIAWVLQRAFYEKEFSIPVGALAAAVCTGLILWGCSWEEAGPAISGTAMIAAIWAGSFFLLFGASTSQQRVRLCQVAVGGVVCAGIFAESTLSLTANRYPVPKEDYRETWRDEATYAAVEQFGLRDAPFVRLERNFLAWGVQQAYTYSCVDYYRGLSFYNSVHNGYYNNFRERILGTTRHRWDWNRRVSYAFGSIGLPMDNVSADLMGLKYVVSEYPVQDPAWEMVQNFEGTIVYQNKSMNTAGLLYTGWCSEADFEELDPVQRQALPAHTLVLDREPSVSVTHSPQVPVQPQENFFLLDTLQATGAGTTAESTVSGFSSVYTGDSDGAVQLQIDPTPLQVPDRQAWVRMQVQADVAGTFTTHCGNETIGFSPIIWNGHTALLQPGVSYDLVMKLPMDTTQLQFRFDSGGTVKVSELTAFHSDGIVYKNDGIQLENPDLGGNVTGRVQAESDSILVIPICKENGWSVQVDGRPAELLTADFAFLAVQLSAGDHTVEFTYKTPGLTGGIGLSAAGCLAFAGLLIGCFRKQKSRKVS